MSKKKSITKKAQGWHKKSLSLKRSFAILFICVLFYFAMLLFYSLFSFYNAGFDGRALGQTISYDLFGIFNGSLFTTSAPTIIPAKIPTQIPSATPTLQPIQSSEYKSTKLGISFRYAKFAPIAGARDGGQRFFVREIQDTIYYYWYAKTNKVFEGNDQQFLSEIAPGSKYVKIFYKNQQQTLSDAIKQYIFNGNIPRGCDFSTEAGYGEPNMNTTYQQTFIIGHRISTNPIHPGLISTIYMPNCTKYASNYKGKSYFIMDPNHSNRFLFVKDGQDNIPSGYQGYMLDGTITIF